MATIAELLAEKMPSEKVMSTTTPTAPKAVESFVDNYEVAVARVYDSVFREFRQLRKELENFTFECVRNYFIIHKKSKDLVFDYQKLVFISRSSLKICFGDSFDEDEVLFASSDCSRVSDRIRKWIDAPIKKKCDVFKEDIERANECGIYLDGKKFTKINRPKGSKDEILDSIILK